MVANLRLPTHTAAVTLGYDYDCDDKNCDRLYRSMNDPNTEIMSKKFKKYLDMSDYENKPGKAKKNAIGIRTENPTKVSIYDIDHQPLLGTICSDNKNSIFN